MPVTVANSIKRRVTEILDQALHRARSVGELRSAPTAVSVELPKRAGRGDYATTVALTLAPIERRPPGHIAEIVKRHIETTDLVESVEIAGPGYVNLTVRPEAWRAVILQVLGAGAEYGRGEASGRSVQVEFVSANPTGPLHVGHGRLAAVGLALANLLAAAGDRVEREYYINDAGRQMRLLGESVWARYCTLAGRSTPVPEDGYQGAYIEEIARGIVGDVGPRYLDAPREEALAAVTAAAYTQLLEEIRVDLDAFGVAFDAWTSERALFASGAVEQVIDRLRSLGYMYEADGALWFQASALGDEKDRVVRKQDGEWTYLASDLAYHLQKLTRGFDVVIDLWGADHHGYIGRIRALFRALGYPDERLRVEIGQLVTVVRKGKPVPMSKRAGTFVTLRDVIDEVGRDAALLTFQMRRLDSPMEFDLELAKEQSSENPVYYIQYAHARVASILRAAAEQSLSWQSAGEAELARLELPEELGLLKALAAYPDVIADAAAAYEPHRLAYFLQELAGQFHGYYYKHRIIGDDRTVSLARVALAAAVGVVIRNGLTIFGVTAPDRM
ncbi:MAG TPA: arginine--tRNA ligase [Nitrospiria bacterium]|nr:arginine--tRNA ligase [Nitrospiria bacterium]